MQFSAAARRSTNSCRIGPHAFIGGLAGVEHDVIPYGIALGNRAHLAGLNLVGLKRRGYSREQIHDLRRAYRALFGGEGTLQERVEQVAAEFPGQPEVDGGAAVPAGRQGSGDLHAARRQRSGMIPAAEARPRGPEPLSDLPGRGRAFRRSSWRGIDARPARRQTDAVRFDGVGGDEMVRRRTRARFFPMSDIAVMGFVPVIRRLPQILRRIEQHGGRRRGRQARRAGHHRQSGLHPSGWRGGVRRRVPAIPIVDYVSPTVWAWRPGRAPAMRAYVDHLLALLPFEPEAHRRLGGPACTYVGHPLIERLDELRPNADERAAREAPTPPRPAGLPPLRDPAPVGRFRRGGGTARRATLGRSMSCCRPSRTSQAEIRGQVARWNVAAANRHRRGRQARRLPASARGAGCLRHGDARTCACRASRWWWPTRSRPSRSGSDTSSRVPSIVLPNLILGRNAIPEFFQDDCTPESARRGPAAAAARRARARRSSSRPSPNSTALMRLETGARTPEPQGGRHRACRPVRSDPRDSAVDLRFRRAGFKYLSTIAGHSYAGWVSNLSSSPASDRVVRVVAPASSGRVGTRQMIEVDDVDSERNRTRTGARCACQR